MNGTKWKRLFGTNVLIVKSTRRSGFVLVLVLLMLTLCGAIVGQFASRVIRLSGQAARAHKELQERWAVVSLRRTCLSQAPMLLGESPSGKPTIKRAMTFVLSGEQYDVSLEDESAKLPVHRMLMVSNTERVKTSMRDVVPSHEIMNPVWPSRPTNLADLFSRPQGLSQFDHLKRWNQIAENITLWSDGTLDFRKCEDATLNCLWHFRFGHPIPDVLTEARNINGSESLMEWLKKRGVDARESEFAELWLQPKGTTYSMWLSSTKQDGNGFTAIYVKRSTAGFADQHFGFHFP